MENLQANLSRYIPNFSKEVLQVAEEELGETPEKREEACSQLYTQFLLSEGPDEAEKYKDKITDPRFLLRFLRVAKFKPEKALGKLKAWLNAFQGEEWPGLTKRLTEVDRLKTLVKANNLCLIQNCSKMHYGPHSAWAIINSDKMRKDSMDSAEYMLDIAAISLIMADYMFRKDEAAQVLGCYNMKNADSGEEKTKNSTWEMLKNPTLLGKLIRLWTKTLAVRNRGSITINQPEEGYIYKALMAVMKPFLSQKMLDRQVRFGNDWKDDERFPLDVDKIPECHGGNFSDAKGTSWVDEYYSESTQL